MNFEEASLRASIAVRYAPLNMTVEKFHAAIPSLVVRTKDEQYEAISVMQWREYQNPPQVILSISSADSFGG